MKIRITQQPLGLFNGKAWPGKGEVVDLPDHVATGIVDARLAELVPNEPSAPDPAPDLASPELAVETATATEPAAETATGTEPVVETATVAEAAVEKRPARRTAKRE